MYIYISWAFYLLTWTYFNDVNGGRNIFVNSQLKRIFFMKKNVEKENNSDGSDFSENEISDLPIFWSILNLNQKQTSEILSVVAVMMRKKVLAEYKVKQIRVSGASAVQKRSLADVLQNSCQTCNFIKKRLQHRCFSMNFTKSLRTPFLTEHLYSDGWFWR